MQLTDNNGSIVATYLDGEGKLARTTLQPFKVRGEAASALAVDDPFYRIALREYDETVKKFNAMPVEIRKQYIDLIQSQIRCDNGAPQNGKPKNGNGTNGKPGEVTEKNPKLSAEVEALYRANVIRHGLKPENPYTTIVRDHESGWKEGRKRLYSVEGYPVDERRVSSPVVISFYMQTKAFKRGNMFETERQLAKLNEVSRTVRAPSPAVAVLN